jgi:hypothetical protein
VYALKSELYNNWKPKHHLACLLVPFFCISGELEYTEGMLHADGGIAEMGLNTAMEKKDAAVLHHSADDSTNLTTYHVVH